MSLVDTLMHRADADTVYGTCCYGGWVGWCQGLGWVRGGVGTGWRVYQVAGVPVPSLARP